MAFMRIPHPHDDPATPRRDYSKVALKSPSPRIPETYRNDVSRSLSQMRKGAIAGAQGRTVPGDFSQFPPAPDAVLPNENSQGFIDYQRRNKRGRRT